MIFTVHTPTQSIYCEHKWWWFGIWKWRVHVDPNHHRPLRKGEKQPLIVQKTGKQFQIGDAWFTFTIKELIVRTDWEAMLKTASEDELRGNKP